MTPTQQAMALFSRQETDFLGWVRNYYEAAFYFQHVLNQIGQEDFDKWAAENFSDAQIPVIADMLEKLHNTPTGQRLMATVKTPE